jgi:hypothetical protein
MKKVLICLGLATLLQTPIVNAADRSAAQPTTNPKDKFSNAKPSENKSTQTSTEDNVRESVKQRFSKAAGGISGGGGKGVVCRDNNGDIRSVELLDLWEARTIYKRQILKSNQSYVNQLADAVHRVEKFMHVETNGMGDAGCTTLAKVRGCNGRETVDLSKDTLRNQIEMYADPFLRNDDNINWMSDVDLELTPDSYEIARPRGNCKIEQIVNLQLATISPFTSKYAVNKDIWDKMDNTNKAATILHESLYAFLKAYFKEPNSVRVRRMVGLVMSGYTFKPLKSIINDEYIHCHSLDEPSMHGFGIPHYTNEFFLTRNGDFVITYAADVPMFGYEPKGYKSDPQFQEDYWKQEIGVLINRSGGESTGGVRSKVDWDLDAEWGNILGEMGNYKVGIHLRNLAVPAQKTNNLEVACRMRYSAPPSQPDTK